VGQSSDLDRIEIVLGIGNLILITILAGR